MKKTHVEHDNEEQLTENQPAPASDEHRDSTIPQEQPHIGEETGQHPKPPARSPRRSASSRAVRGEKSAERAVGRPTSSPTAHREGSPAINRPATNEDEDDDHLTIPDVLPVLPLKDTVIYPFSVQPLAVGQERSIRLIDDVMRSDRLVVLVAQKSIDIEQAGPDDIFPIGTVSRVARLLRMPDGTVQIIVQGLERVSLGAFTQEKPYLAAHVTLQPDTQEQDTETEAIKRNVIGYFQRLVALVQTVPQEVAAATLNLEEARQVVYVIATFLQMDLELRQKLLELDSVRAKLQTLSLYLTHELEILELGKVDF
jgi:ATP-dependent Lon protease